MSFAAAKVLARLALLYDPPPVEDYGRYLAHRDPVVGWPSRAQFGDGEYDRAGSRVVPGFADPAQPSCAALFGDSFTWGDEVSPAESYGSVLARLMQCRVANYGVGGYGTDQAYLRYRQVVKDDAPIVILGHYSENIIRNVNQERGFLGNQVLGLKPRFIMDGDNLKLVPLPQLTEAQYAQLPQRASELLPYDYFAPGGPAGIRTLHFPFTLSAFGAIGHYRIRARIEQRPSYAPFYDPGHPSQALRVTEAIIKSFAAEARHRQQKAMVLLIPDEKDLRLLREHGSLPYAELADRLRKAQIVVPDVAGELNRGLGSRDPCELYTRCGNGHFTASGYAKLAAIVHAQLIELGWVRRP